MKKFIFCYTIFCIVSCSPIIGSYTSAPRPDLSSSVPVYIFTPDEELPKDVLKVGGLKYSAKKINLCQLDYQLNRLKKEARKKGANVIKVETFGNHNGECFDTMVTFYFLENFEKLKGKDETYNAHSEYAKLYIVPSINPNLNNQLTHKIAINDKRIELNQYTKHLEFIKPQDAKLQVEGDDILLKYRFEEGKNYYFQIDFNTNTRKFELNKLDPIIGRLIVENNSNQLNESIVNAPFEIDENESEQSKASIATIKDGELTNNSTASNQFNIKNTQSKNTATDNRIVQANDYEEEVIDSNWFDFNLRGGLIYNLGSSGSQTSSDLKRVVEGLRWGRFAEVSASYFFDNENGMGLTYYNSYSTTTQNITSRFNALGLNNQFLVGRASVSMQSNYYGAHYIGRYSLSKNNKNLLKLNFGLGLIETKEQYSFSQGSLSFETSTFALNSSITYDIFLTSKLYLGLIFGLLLATTDEATASNGVQSQKINLDENLNLSSFNLGLGLRYTF